MPLARHGAIRFCSKNGERTIRIDRIHIEEDAGKSVIKDGERLVDLNRAGVPLVEIVTEPDLRSGKEAAQCFEEIRNVVMAVGACNGNMEEGNLRCDANVSLRRDLCNDHAGSRVEIKNINSFRFVQRAVDYEIKRQQTELQQNRDVVSETRGWDESTGCTFSQRVKESSDDYRYCIDLDLPPLVLTDNWVQAQRELRPELPRERRERYSAMGVSMEASAVFASNGWMAAMFDGLVAGGIDVRLAGGFLTTVVLRDCGSDGAAAVDLEQIANLLQLQQQGLITARQGKELYSMVLGTGNLPSDLVDELGMRRIEENLSAICGRVVESNPALVQAYRGGKVGLMGFFMGEVMKATKGSADPVVAREVLVELLTGS